MLSKSKMMKRSKKLPIFYFPFVIFLMRFFASFLNLFLSSAGVFISTSDPKNPSAIVQIEEYRSSLQ
ncbi:MAG: hypothetical protein CM15mP22_2860 [Gammaproteobacteria bacterium]|nr:MAG: hypothetical protein CM15mP22_2860 [Gammaproteobacteria bacterium]